MADDIERWMADEPVSGWREPFARRARRWARRHRTLVTAAAAAALVATAGLAAILLLQARANAELRQANEEALARFTLARDAVRSLQNAVTGDMLKDDKLRPFRDGLLRTSVNFYTRLAATTQGRTDASSRRNMAADYHDLAGLMERIGNRSEALEAYEKEAEVRRSLLETPAGAVAENGDVLELANTLTRLGLVAEQAGEWRKALDTYDEIGDRLAPLVVGPSFYPRARELIALTLLRTGIVYYRLGKTGTALDTFRRTKEAYGSLYHDYPSGNTNAVNLATTQDWIATILTETGQTEEGLAEGRRAFELLRPLMNRKWQDRDYARSQMGEILTTIGLILAHTGRPDEAMASYREALAFREELAHEKPADTDYILRIAECHDDIGELLARTGRPEEAMAEYRRALNAERRWRSPTPRWPPTAGRWPSASPTSPRLCRAWAGPTRRWPQSARPWRSAKSWPGATPTRSITAASWRRAIGIWASSCSSPASPGPP